MVRKGKYILSTCIQGEVTTNSNKQKISKWRNTLDRTLASHRFEKIHSTKFRISLTFWISRERLQNRKNDLDNLSKPVLDSLKRIGMILDDAYIYQLEVAKFPTIGEEEVKISVREWN